MTKGMREGENMTHVTGCECDECCLAEIDAFVASRKSADVTARDGGQSICRWLSEEWATRARENLRPTPLPWQTKATAVARPVRHV